jgi:hypothetical protein
MRLTALVLVSPEIESVQPKVKIYVPSTALDAIVSNAPLSVMNYCYPVDVKVRFGYASAGIHETYVSMSWVIASPLSSSDKDTFANVSDVMS